jgi:ABC-type bacteriocin/lantibiotic exporter with double-glycine peptidase domain
MSAAEQVFEVLDEPVPAQGKAKAVPDPAAHGLVVEGLGVTYPGRRQPALDCISLHIAPGQVLGVTGPNGCGKSTLLAVLLGCVTPTRGIVRSVEPI